MNKILLLTLLVLATVLGACSKDDDREGQRGVNGERLVGSLTCTSDDESYTNKYEYDKQGRIIKLECTETYNNKTSVYHSFYTYEKNKIVVDDDGDKYIYTLNDKGLIIKSSDPEYGDIDYQYNDQNQLIRIQGNYENFNITWKDGNITKEEYSDKNQTHAYTYSYNNNENKTIGLNVMYDFGTLNNPLFYCGYFGSTNKNLVSASSDRGSSYEYEFDKDGYVTVMRGYKTENGKKILDGTITVEYK
ncbi:DUF4595 domain-containing protein [Odoribacter sp. OF09-27XD]|jgi:hypothetical protein|nr:DUF4595 domain-containing protein [Odoribacter sp. OF09-27XD]RHV87552.1 DUF4595 domain-containing protein [Odoribacter sp. OF09-27XD]